MTRVARALRLDQGTWRWLKSEASLTGAGLVVLGAYLILAFNRFGWPDFAVRATTRLMLTGLYGWLWLALATWVIVRLVYAIPVSASVLLRLTGHAHLPLLLVALVILVTAVMLDFTNVSYLPALFAGVFWMPAMLVKAVAASSELSLRRAAPAAALPYLLWAAMVGRLLWRQLAHLL